MSFFFYASMRKFEVLLEPLHPLMFANGFLQECNYHTEKPN